MRRPVVNPVALVRAQDGAGSGQDCHEAVVRALTIGQPAPIEVVRDGRHVTLTVTPAPDN